MGECLGETVGGKGVIVSWGEREDAIPEDERLKVEKAVDKLTDSL
jgi:hypothetical protein